MKTEAQKRATAKWDAQNIKAVTVKMRRDLADRFEEICTKRGTTRNAVLLAYIREYVAAAEAEENPGEDTEN